MEHCVLLKSVVHCVLAVSVRRLVNEHMLIQVSTWLNTRGHKVLCHSGVDGVHTSVTVNDVDALTLSVQTSSKKVGDLRAVDGIKFRELCLALPITPRLQRTRLLVTKTHPGICSTT